MEGRRAVGGFTVKVRDEICESEVKYADSHNTACAILHQIHHLQSSVTHSPSSTHTPQSCASVILPPEPFDSRQTHLESLVLIISPPDILGQLLKLLDLLLVLPLETTSDLFHKLVIVHIGPGVPDDLGLAGKEVEFEELEQGGEGLFLFVYVMRGLGN